jgi:hypothetical protein
MRKLLALFAAAFLVALASIPASAQGGLPCDLTANGGSGGVGCTVSFHNVVMDFGPAGPDICPNLPTGELLVTANGVFHINVNGAGDFWITETITGSASIITGTPAAPVNHFTGHLEAWFGQENNMPIGVMNDVANVMGTNLDTGQSLRVHFEQHALYVPDTNPPQIIPTGAHSNMTCA